MKWSKKMFNCLFLFSAALVLFYIFRDRGKLKTQLKLEKFVVETKINLAVVACGQRLRETLTMLKSAILFNQGKHTINLIVVADESLELSFQEKLTDWQETVPGHFTFQIKSLQFPKQNSKEWKNLFKLCAAQRLFLPTLLSELDSILYLDTDTLLLSPVSEIWSHFDNFNSSQIAALTPEHEDKNVGWYNRFARHPYYGPLGVNSGVMLMNLTRMRSFQWESRILPLHIKYKMKITWGDQDLINIMFYFHPEKLYLLPCKFNYRPDHCMYMSICNTSGGVQILHGNRGYFHIDKQPTFKTIYKTMESYQLGKDPYKHFLKPLENALTDDIVVNSNCGKASNSFLIKSKSIFLKNDYFYK